MKRKMRRTCMLLTFLASAVVAPAQSVFSVTETSKGEFVWAEQSSSRYNVYPAGSVAANEVTGRVLELAQSKFAALDVAIRKDIQRWLEYEDSGLDERRLQYFPELKLYGFVVPNSPFDYTTWWYDAETGGYIYSTLQPAAMNVNGIYVSQVGYDCDWALDLRFFRREGDHYFRELMAFKDIRYNGEPLKYHKEVDGRRTIFWYGDNVLYIMVYDRRQQNDVYLKITLELN